MTDGVRPETTTLYTGQEADDWMWTLAKDDERLAILRLLNGAYQLTRSILRGSPDLERAAQEVHDEIGDYLYPDDLRRPQDRWYAGEGPGPEVPELRAALVDVAQAPPTLADLRDAQLRARRALGRERSEEELAR